MRKLWNKAKEIKTILVEKVQDRIQSLTVKVVYPVQNQSGATITEILGYSLVAVLAIALIWGLIKGWIPTFFNNITGKLNNLS